MVLDASALATSGNVQQQASIAQQIASLQEAAMLLASIGLMKTDPGRIPGPVTIPQCAQVRLFWTLGNGKTVTNVLHGAYTGSFNPTVTMADQLQTAMNAALTSSNLAGQLHNSTALFGVGLRDISAAHTTEFLSNQTSQPGTGTGTALPPQTALVVTLRTGLAGQGGRGRVYIPGWASIADVGNGVATVAATSAAQSFINTFSTAINQTGIALTFVIAHPARAAYTGKTGTAHAARPASTVPITGIFVENAVWDTQRRRAEP
jgi:hypothetical protein